MTVEERPIATVDAVILTLMEGELHVVLYERDHGPDTGSLALPGGYIHTDEDGGTEDAIRRVLREKVGLNGMYLEQLATFSGQHRDPRGWSISVTYLSLAPRSRLSSGEERGMRLMPVEGLTGLAFDHDTILAAALSRLRGKGAYSSLPASLLEDTFTLPELQSAYETVLGERIDPSSFRKKILDSGIIRETGERRTGVPSRRPAALYELCEGPRTLQRTFGNSA